MRAIFGIAFALLLIGPLRLPANAAEPDAPATLIDRAEAVRIAVQERLSAKFTSPTEPRKSEQGALVEYYSVADNRLLWVDGTGLTDSGKSVLEEIKRADEYGLRSSDYEFPKEGAPSEDDSAAVDFLADAEIKLSFAVL